MKRLIVILFLIVGISLLYSQTDSTNISWNANPPEENVTGYNLYKGTGGPLIQIWSGLALTTSDRNGIVPGGTYCYALTATNANGTSSFSDTVCVGIPIVTLTLTSVKNDTVIPLANVAMDPDLQPLGIIPEAPVNCTVTTDASNLYLIPSGPGLASFAIRVVDLPGFWDRRVINFINTVYPATSPDSVRVTK